MAADTPGGPTMEKTNVHELHELKERIAKLTVPEQLSLISGIAGRLVRDHFTDREAEAKANAEFVAQWIAQGGEKYPYPLPEGHEPPCVEAKSTS
jgi:hypothetical protein